MTNPTHDGGFTAGPWEREREGLARSIYAGGKLIAQIVGDSAEAEANGDLIEAAPDLLDALRAAYAFIAAPQRFETPKDGPKTATYRADNYNALTTKLRAAIAKAGATS